MSDAPERIWIAPTFGCKEPDDYYLLHPDYRQGKGTEYVRADLSNALLAEKVREALTEAARIGYVACAETRHVTLGMSVEQRILALRDQKEPKG